MKDGEPVERHRIPPDGREVKSHGEVVIGTLLHTAGVPFVYETLFPFPAGKAGGAAGPARALPEDLRDYRPDFYLPDDPKAPVTAEGGVWLEHYAHDRGHRRRAPPDPQPARPRTGAIITPSTDPSGGSPSGRPSSTTTSRSTGTTTRSRTVFLDHTWVGPGPLAGHGLRFIPVARAGNTNASAEEATGRQYPPPRDAVPLVGVDGGVPQVAISMSDSSTGLAVELRVRMTPRTWWSPGWRTPTTTGACRRRASRFHPA